MRVGEEGRLWAKSPCKMIGYWNNNEATQEVVRGGWLDTGDVLKADEDGYLWFRGRKKQIMVHDASNICPQEVEEVLLGHGAVDNAGVVGVYDRIHGEGLFSGGPSIGITASIHLTFNVEKSISSEWAVKARYSRFAVQFVNGSAWASTSSCLVYSAR